MTDDNDWFAPKRFGYGAGLPIRWQGWATMLIYLAVVLVDVIWLLPRHSLAGAVLLVAATLAMVILTAQHTRGGWKWRWGGDG